MKQKQKQKAKQQRKRRLWGDAFKKHLDHWKKRRANQNPYPQSRKSIA